MKLTYLCMYGRGYVTFDLVWLGVLSYSLYKQQ